jgi:hypothetical protein
MNKPARGRRTPPLAILVAFILTASLVGLVVLQGLVRPDSSTQSGSIQFIQATKMVTPGQDMTVKVGTVTVYLPKDAASEPGTISIIPREANLFPTTGDTVWTRPQVVNIEYQNNLGTPYPGLVFNQAAEVCFELTQDQWNDYSWRPDAYQVHSYAEDQNPPHWVLLPTTNRSQTRELCGQTTHLSLFALAVKADVNIPITGFTPFPTPGLYAP